MSYPGEYQTCPGLGRIPVDETPESFAGPTLPMKGETLFRWNPLGDEDETGGPVHCFLIGWEANEEGIDDENFAIRHTCSYVGREKCGPSIGAKANFVARLDSDSELLRAVIHQIEKECGL